jgi:hypothetical protein
MQLLPQRWTIDFWPMRTIVSVYLVVTGGLIAMAIITAGLMVQAMAAAASAATLRVFGALLFARPAAAGPAQASLAPYLVSGAAIGVFFLVAVVLMWVRARQNWVAAAVAAFIGGGAWWLLAYAVLAQHPAPSVQSAVVFVVMTAVVTLGVLAATLQRARDED